MRGRAFVLMVALCACAPPIRALPRVYDDAPKTWPAHKDTPASDEIPETAWWNVVLRPAVQRVIETAIDGSPSLTEAKAAVAEAKARIESARGLRKGTLTLAGGGGAGLTENSGFGVFADVSLSASLPLDLSGGLGAQVDAAVADWQATRAVYEDAVTNVASSAADLVIVAAEAGARVRVLQEQIELSDTLVRLTEMRFAQGQASVVDVLQQRDQRVSLEQELPRAKADLRVSLDLLSALSGQIVGTSSVPDAQQAFEVPMPARLTSPKALLQARPDLRARWVRVQAADFRFARALAARWPTFNLNAVGGARQDEAVRNSFVRTTLDATWRFYQGGRLQAQIDAQRAVADARAAGLLQAWLDALAQVDGLMAEEQQRDEELFALDRRLKTARAVLNAARQRYQLGAGDYLSVVTAVQTLQRLERDVLGIRARLARTRVALHSALGVPVREGGPLP